LGEFGNWIAEHPATAGSGHLGQVVYVETLSTCLLWHGHDRFLDEALEQAAQMGINARVEYRAMSLPQLIEASGWLMDNAERWAEDGFHINSIGSIGAVEGLEVVGLFTGPLAARDGGTVSVWVEMKRDQLAARIAKSVGAVVRLVEGDIVDC
jgi:hypothetical protein